MTGISSSSLHWRRWANRVDPSAYHCPGLVNANPLGFLERLLGERELWPKGWAPNLIDSGCWMVEIGQGAQSAQAELARHFIGWVRWKPSALRSFCTVRVPSSMMLAAKGADHDSHDALGEFLQFLGLLI